MLGNSTLWWNDQTPHVHWKKFGLIKVELYLIPKCLGFFLWKLPQNSPYRKQGRFSKVGTSFGISNYKIIYQTCMSKCHQILGTHPLRFARLQHSKLKKTFYNLESKGTMKFWKPKKPFKFYKKKRKKRKKLEWS
jgi:hypothetical protein